MEDVGGIMMEVADWGKSREVQRGVGGENGKGRKRKAE